MEQRFGDYTLLDSEVQINKDSRKLLHVVCKCGKIDFKQERYLLNGKTTSCKSCSAKKTASNYPMPVRRTGFGELSGTHYIAIKAGAERRNIEFNITPQYLWELFLLQDGKCALTDVNIILNRSIKNQNVNWDIITASLDRKDSNIGYVEGNLWWVHKDINRLKNNYSMDVLLYWAKLLVNKHGNPELSVSNDVIVDTKVQRLGGEKSINNPPTSAQPLAIG